MTHEEFVEWAKRLSGQEQNWYRLVNEEELALEQLAGHIKDVGGHFINNDNQVMVVVKDGLIWQI